MKILVETRPRPSLFDHTPREVPPVVEVQPPAWRDPWVIGVVTVIGLALGLRLYGLDSRPLWLDEGSTWQFSQNPLRSVISGWPPLDFSYPPGHNLLMWGWTRVVGDTPALMRLSSVLLSVASVGFTMGIGRLIRGRAVGLLAGLLVAIAPLHIQHGQEVRAYALLAFAVSMSLWALAWLYTHRHDAMHSGLGRWVWGVHVVGNALALYAHNTGIVFVGTSVLAVWVFWFNSERDPRFLRNALVAHFSLFLLWLPWLPTFVVQMTRTSDVAFAHGAPALGNLPLPYLGDVVAPLERHLVLATFVGLVIAGAVAIRYQRRWMALLVGVVLLPVGFFYAVDQLVQPMLQTKLVLWALTPLMVLVAIGALRCRRLIGIPAVGLVVFGLAVTTNFYLTEPERANWETGFERWPQAAAATAAVVEQGDQILYNAGYVQSAFGYYFDRGVWVLNPDSTEASRSAVRDDTWMPASGMTGVEQVRLGMVEPGDEAALAEIVAGQDRVFVVVNRDYFWDPEGVVLAELEDLYGDPEVIFDTGLADDVRVLLFEG